MNISCEIVRDLLPLYVDEVCSADSRKAVDEHLKTCEKCTDELRLMKEALLETDVIAEEVDSAKAAKKAWKKNKLKFGIIGLMIATLLCGLCYVLTVPNILPVDESHLEVGDVYRMEDGSIRLELSVTDGLKHNFIRYRTVDDSFYITPMQAVLASKEDPEWAERKNTGHHVIGSKAVGSSLYVGWGDDAILVWEEGMELPPAPVGIEAEYAEMYGE